MRAAPGRIVVASGNRGKLREIAALLEPLGFEITPQAALGVTEVEENGDSFVANALLKAHHAADATGLPTLADDSGLLVDALDGRPGIHSARYAGNDASDDDNIERLLQELADVDVGRRGAAFHCAAVFVRSTDDPQPLIVEASWRGRILTARAVSGGFGYDPVFADADSGRAASLLTAQEKNACSHRGQAFRALAARLQQP